MNNYYRRFAGLGIIVILIIVSGCGKEKLQGFSGQVTYDGKPLEFGIVTFTPDAEKGNLNGASNLASIKEGRYELPKDQGISGGWYRVIVNVTAGGDGEIEKQVFPPYTISNEFKPDDKTFDIDIPKNAGK